MRLIASLREQNRILMCLYCFVVCKVLNIIMFVETQNFASLLPRCRGTVLCGATHFMAKVAVTELRNFITPCLQSALSWRWSG